MTEQVGATTGRRIRRPYQSMISAQAAQLPQVYQAKEQRQFQEESAEMSEREFALAEESQKKQEEQAKRASFIGAVGTGAMIGAQTAHPYGVAIGAGAGAVGWAATEYFGVDFGLG